MQLQAQLEQLQAQLSEVVKQLSKASQDQKDCMAGTMHTAATLQDAVRQELTWVTAVTSQAKAAVANSMTYQAQLQWLRDNMQQLPPHALLVQKPQVRNHNDEPPCTWRITHIVPLHAHAAVRTVPSPAVLCPGP